MIPNRSITEPVATLTLKGIPDALLDRLRSAAENERRSLNQQAIFLLERALPNRSPGDFQSFIKTFQAEWGVGDLTDSDFEGLRMKEGYRDGSER
jgi:hypothetical protein